MIKRIFFIAFAFFSLSASSQDTLSLEEVRVTGISLKAKKTASRMLPSKQNTMATETPAYLSKVGSVIWQSDNGTPYGYSYLRIRGMDQQRINFTVNGIPLNDGEDMGVYTSNITDLLSSVQEVRVTRGSGGSLSGTPVFAGSVEMDMFVPDSATQEIELGAGSFGSYRASVLLANSRLKFRASLTGSDGWREHSWGKSASYAFTYRTFAGKWMLVFNSLGGDTRNAQAWLPVPEGMNIRSNLLDPEEKDHFRQAINQLQAVTKIGRHNLVLSPYWVNLHGNYSYSIDPTTLGNLRLKWNNVGGYAALKRSIENARNGYFLRYSLGGTLNSHKREHFGSVEPYLTRLLYENYGKKIDASAFFKFDYNGPFRLEGDLQLRKSKLDYVAPEYSFGVFDYTFFNWRAMLSREISSANVYFMVSQSHREPTRTDIFGWNDHYTSSNIGELRKVTAEKVTDYEAGVLYKKHRLNFFWMEYNNEIVTQGDINFLGIQVRTNTPRSRRFGIEGEASLEIKKLLLTGNFCLMKAVDTKTDMKTPFSPAFVYNVILAKEKKTWKAELWLRHSSSQQLDYSPEEVSKIPAFTTLNFSGEKSFKKFKIRASVNNLFDDPYASGGNLNYDLNTGRPISRNLFYQSGISFFTSINVQL